MDSPKKPTMKKLYNFYFLFLVLILGTVVAKAQGGGEFHAQTTNDTTYIQITVGSEDTYVSISTYDVVDDIVDAKNYFDGLEPKCNCRC